MTNELEVLDPTGHLSLTWNPDDPESVAKAGAEFDRLKDAGYAFFTTPESSEKVTRLTKKVLTESSSLDARHMEPEQTSTFNPRARRTTAVPPLRGG